MTITLLATLLSILSVAGQTDTTFKVRPGTRLNVNNFGGDIVVQSWDKSMLRIQASHSERAWITIMDAGQAIDVRAATRRGIPAQVDYHISAPRWMPLSLSGIYSDLSVDGSKSEISAETVKGDISVNGGMGFIKLSSVQGAVNVGHAHGRLELTSVNDAVNVSDIEGDISVDAVNGDVTLERIQSNMVEAATVTGNVIYLGEIRDGGRYRFASHNGNLMLAVPDRANATFSMATFNGGFESSFPVNLTQTRRGRRFSFALGTGSAQVDLETFEGTISLRRALAIKEKLKEMMKEKEKDKQDEKDNESEEEK